MLSSKLRPKKDRVVAPRDAPKSGCQAQDVASNVPFGSLTDRRADQGRPLYPRERDMLASKSTSAKCQYQTLPMFGAAPPRQAEQSRESYKPSRCTERYWRRTRPLSPGVATRDLSFAMAPTQLSYLRVARRGALQTTVSRASMRSTVVRGVGSFRRIGTASPGSYMRLRLGSTVRVTPKSELDMGMPTR